MPAQHVDWDCYSFDPPMVCRIIVMSVESHRLCRHSIAAMNDWSAEKVLALAPDAGSASAGQGLASVKKWTGLGRSERAIWGLCQGSGKDPYQARVDLGEPAFKCSCPSRKFPCKHGLGLLLVFAKDAASFTQAAEPGWVSDWLATREARADETEAKAKEVAEKPVDAEAQAKRAAQRQGRVRDGVGMCRVWLEDVVRKGLAAAQLEPAANWERAAARMVDAQAPGLAGYVRRIPEVLAGSDGPGGSDGSAGWEVQALDVLGRLHLLLTAAERLETLPPDLAGDVRTALGWNQPKEEVLAGAGGPPLADRWQVLGQVVVDDERLRTRRTWLVGQRTARRALVLDFAAGSASMDASLVAGMEFDGELSFYPGRLGLRALVKSRGDGAAMGQPSPTAADATVQAGLQRYAEALAANPWTERWPLVLTGVSVVQAGDAWLLADGQSAALPLAESFVRSGMLWKLLAASGGHAVTMLAEWDGRRALPVSALAASGFCNIAPRWVGWVA